VPSDVDLSSSSSGADADEGARAQSRLRDLVHAISRVVEALDIEVVLTHIVKAAMSLVGARYGGLGVITSDGSGLERFIQVGMDPETVEHIGGVRVVMGLLGALNASTGPIRLEHLADDPNFVEFPAHHPGVGAFLGVSIGAGDDVVGTLYLSQDRQHPPFTAESEELIVALAATAGMAIANARLYDVARERELWRIRRRT